MSDKNHILIIDDDQDLQQLLRFTFESNGFTVETAGDGEDGLEYVESGETVPDLIILDLQMPALGGIDFLRRTVDTARLEAVPIVVLTGIDNDDTLTQAFELGADEYVTKPFSPTALVSRCNRLL